MDKNNLTIMTLIEKTDKSELIDALNLSMSHFYEIANKLFGEGYFGQVIRPTYSPKMEVIVKDTEVILNTVVKIFKRPGKNMMLLDIDQNIIDTSLKYFYENSSIKIPKIVVPKNLSVLAFDDHLLGEIIILMYLSKLWYESITPHVPYLLMPMAYDRREIDSALLEMNGIPARYFYKMRGIVPDIYGQDIASSHLENMNGLVSFIINHAVFDNEKDTYLIPKLEFEVDDNKSLKLRDSTPSIDIVKLLDTLVLSYLISLHHLKFKLGLILSDQRLDNIFLAYPQFGLHAGKRDLQNIKKIRYDLKSESKSYEVDIYGPILKIGDVGSGVMKIRDDLILASDLIIDKDNYYLHKIFIIDKLPTYLTFLTQLNDNLPMDMRIRLINNRILNSEKFRNFSIREGVDFSYPSELELVEEYYQDYLTSNNSPDSEKLFIVKI